MRARTQGFTLLEVMVAMALLSIVTGGAMAAFLAQSRATNTQQTDIQANDEAREAIRLISNDLRTAAAGISPGGGGAAKCAAGSIPFDGAGTNFSCLPPVFRSNLPLMSAVGGVFPNPGASLPLAGQTLCSDKYHPGYQLDFGNGVFVPQTQTGTALNFCPDDLVVVAADDANPLFMVQGTAGFSSTKNTVNSITFAGTVPSPRSATAPVSTSWAGLGFDDASPTSFLATGSTAACISGGLSAAQCGILSQSLMLFGGPSGAVLMNASLGAGAPAYGAGAACSSYGSPTSCNTTTYAIIPATVGLDLVRNNLALGSVAIPARLFKYWIQPINASGGFTPPFVSANLVRSTVLPINTGTTGKDEFLLLNSTVLANGVVDLQVEFGIANPLAGGLVYVNSGGLQAAPWTPGIGAPPAALTGANGIDNCNGGTDTSVWSGVCFPTNGTNGLGAVNNLRSVRLNLTVRSGANINTRGVGEVGGATAVGAVYTLQAPVQDVTGGNLESQVWGAVASPVMTQDGAQYRQVSTEVYVRNLGWTNNL